MDFFTLVYNNHEGGSIWFNEVPLHVDLANQRLSTSTILSIQYNHGIPRDHIWFMYLLKHHPNIHQALTFSTNVDQSISHNNIWSMPTFCNATLNRFPLP